jgi:predicted metalloenzyme YecM
MILSTRVNARKVYLTTTPDKLGRIPERKAVEVKVVDWPKDTRYYITSWEQVSYETSLGYQ